MKYEGSNCPICHNKKETSAKLVAVSVVIVSVVIVGIVIVGIVIMLGVLFYTGGIEIDQENLDESIQNVLQKLQETGELAKDFVTETTIVLREILNQLLENVKLEPINIPVDNVINIPVDNVINIPVDNVINIPVDNVINIPVDDVINITKTIREDNPINKKPIIDKTKLEQQVHDLINQYRTQNGLATLSWDSGLSNVARYHSQDMALRNYFSHDTPEGKDPTDRGIAKGYRCEKTIGNLIYSGIAENIFQNNLYDTVWYINGIPTSYDWNDLDEIAQSTVDGWMDSSGHRQNILTKTYDREGIGVEISSDDKVYITQNFC